MTLIPINEDDFDEPDWLATIEISFPPCGSLKAVGGIRLIFPCQAASQEAEHGTVDSTPSYSLALIPNMVDNQRPSALVNLTSFAAPFFGQPGDSVTQHCSADSEPTIDDGSCPKVDAGSHGKNGIGHIPPFVLLAAVNMACQEESSRICHDWLDHDTNRCDTKKSALDESISSL